MMTSQKQVYSEDLHGDRALPADVIQNLNEEEAYLVHKLPVYKLIDKEFIEAFVKKGCIYFLSHNTHIDTDDCVALLPTGTLVLNLTKDTYEQLGLEGKPSIFTPRHQKPSKYVIHLDLTPDYFLPGKKNYNRVWCCLKDRLHLVLDFLVIWVPTDEKICPSSLQLYYKNRGHDVTTVPLRQKARKICNKTMPVLNNDSVRTQDDSHKVVYEWLGSVMCDIDATGSPDDYLTTYTCPEPSQELSMGSILQASGFIPPHLVTRLLESLQTFLQKHGDKCPWAMLTVHGFCDAPVSWGKREHGFYLGGDNLYTYLVFPDRQYWLYSALATHDECH